MDKDALEKAVQSIGSDSVSYAVADVKQPEQVEAYMASKHAIIGIMRVAAIEVASLGIRVNTINPGPVESRMMDSLKVGVDQLLKVVQPDVENPPAKEIVLMNTPNGRYATLEEVAKMMLFLASDDSSHCTGGTYMVDGGFTCH